MIGYVVVLVCCLNVVFGGAGKNTQILPHDAQEALAIIHDACVKSSGVTDEDVQNVDMANASQEMKCYMTCLMKEGHWLKEDGHMDFEAIQEHLMPSLKTHVTGALEGCREIEVGAHECDIGYNFNVCFQKIDPEGFFLP